MQHLFFFGQMFGICCYLKRVFHTMVQPRYFGSQALVARGYRLCGVVSNKWGEVLSQGPGSPSFILQAEIAQLPRHGRGRDLCVNRSLCFSFCRRKSVRVKSMWYQPAWTSFWKRNDNKNQLKLDESGTVTQCCVEKKSPHLVRDVYLLGNNKGNTIWTAHAVTRYAPSISSPLSSPWSQITEARRSSFWLSVHAEYR